MVRLTTTLVASLFLLTPAFGMRADRKAPLDFGSAAPQRLKESAPAAQEDSDLEINDDTEIKLDGKACKYEDVPKDAQIIVLDVSADRKILKIHFKSKPRK